MRNFVEITGGKLKRVTNRRDGCYFTRHDDDEPGKSRADHRRQRRLSRQQLRLNAGQLTGDDEFGDFLRDGTTIINTDNGMSRQRAYGTRA
jgi:hypothetical protein